jgi:hypothetical protein
MRRFVLLSYICLAFACFAGCHKWHHKHFLRACHGCDPCGCYESAPSVIEGVPVPSGAILPAAPLKGIPIVPGTATPQAPNVRISTPQG